MITCKFAKHIRTHQFHLIYITSTSPAPVFQQLSCLLAEFIPDVAVAFSFRYIYTRSIAILRSLKNKHVRVCRLYYFCNYIMAFRRLHVFPSFISFQRGADTHALTLLGTNI